MSKYTNARYPDKINDLVDNDGNVNIPGGETPFEWNTTLDQELPMTESSFYLILNDEDWATIANTQPIKIKAHVNVDGEIETIDLVYSKLITAGVQYAGHMEGMVCYIDMGYNFDVQKVAAFFSLSGVEPQPEPSDVNDFEGFAAAVQECYDHLNDRSYSNSWTFKFKDALTSDLGAALSNVPVYNALWQRGVLYINLTEVLNNNKNHQNQEVTFGIQKPFLRVWMTTEGEPIQQMEFGCYQFSGTITLVFYDDQE